MTNVRLTGKRSIWVALAMVVVAAVLGARFAIATHAAEPGEDTGGIHVELSALAGAPDAKAAPTSASSRARCKAQFTSAICLCNPMDPASSMVLGSCGLTRATRRSWER